MNRNQQRKWQRKLRRRERRRERRRAEREAQAPGAVRLRAERFQMCYLTLLRDPIAMLIGVLVFRGLPEEIARLIVFEYSPLIRPGAWAFRKDRQARSFLGVIDTWMSEPEAYMALFNDESEGCFCPWYNDECGYGVAPNGEEYYYYPRTLGDHVHDIIRPRSGHVRDRYCTTMTRVAACHSRTTHLWRGEEPAFTFEWMEDHYGDRGVQVWENRSLCAHTVLWLRVWLNIHDEHPGPGMPIGSHEFSLVRWLKETRMHRLADSIEENRGHPCVGGTREQRARTLMNEIRWEKRDYWNWGNYRDEYE